MINFEHIEEKKDELKSEFLSYSVEHVVVDNFIKIDSIDKLLEEIPNPVNAGINKSRDYFFAKNKYEKSGFSNYGHFLAELEKDLLSDRFQSLLSFVTGEKVFIDPEFHGGGLHQGGVGSFLNMHADFNYHPFKKNWFRNLNILIYLNPDWKEEYGGQLKLRHKSSGESFEIEPLLNRCVIMFTRDYTLHGYDEIFFPEGTYRRSIAAYAYSNCDLKEKKIILKMVVN